MSRRVRRTRGRRRYAHGGSHNGMRMNNSCPPGMHMMPDGTCMEGAYHGASSSDGGYRRGGNTRRYAHGGRNNGCGPGEMCHGGSHNGMRRGGRTRRRMQQGGHATPQHYHAFNTSHHHPYGDPSQIDVTNYEVQGGHTYEAVGDGTYQSVPMTYSGQGGRHTHRQGIQGITPRGRMRRGGTARRFEHGGHHESERASDYTTKHRGRDAHGRTIQR